MHREEEVVTAVQARLSNDNGSSPEEVLQALHDIESALEFYGDSLRLWCLRGDLIQLAPETSPYTLEDAKASYEHALAGSPEAAEPHVALGYLLDAVYDDPASAEPHFRQA